MTWNIAYNLNNYDRIFIVDRSGINDNQLNGFVEFMIKQELSFVKAYNGKKVTFDHKKKIVILSENN